MNLYQILKEHGLEKNEKLMMQLQGHITAIETKEYDNGFRAGEHKQAILELSGRDNFVSGLRSKREKMVQEIIKIVEKF